MRLTVRPCMPRPWPLAALHLPDWDEQPLSRRTLLGMVSQQTSYTSNMKVEQRLLLHWHVFPSLSLMAFLTTILFPFLSIHLKTKAFYLAAFADASPEGFVFLISISNWLITATRHRIRHHAGSSATLREGFKPSPDGPPHFGHSLIDHCPS